MYVPVNIPYKTYRWERPSLSLEDEIAMGEQINRLGKKAFRKAFLNPSKVETLKEPRVYTGRDVAKIAGLVAAAAATAVAAPAVLLAAFGLGLQAGIVGGGMTYGGRLLTLWKFNRWLDHCESKYLEHKKEETFELFFNRSPVPPPTPRPTVPSPIPTTRIIICICCEQALRIPDLIGRMKVTCPHCRTLSYFPHFYRENGMPNWHRVPRYINPKGMSHQPWIEIRP